MPGNCFSGGGRDSDDNAGGGDARLYLAIQIGTLPARQLMMNTPVPRHSEPFLFLPQLEILFFLRLSKISPLIIHSFQFSQ